uniref:Uncharacterized protein n=1 Tax=Arundo donax TaxID=35708 RepID=A0A0A8Z2P8_ARUDO
MAACCHGCFQFRALNARCCLLGHQVFDRMRHW